MINLLATDFFHIVYEARSLNEPLPIFHEKKNCIPKHVVNSEGKTFLAFISLVFFVKSVFRAGPVIIIFF